MWTKQFWGALVERAVKTIAQAAVAFIAAGATGLFDIDWVGLVSVAGLAGLVSALTTIGSGIATGGPSLAGERLPGEVSAYAVDVPAETVEVGELEES